MRTLLRLKQAYVTTILTRLDMIHHGWPMV